MPITHFFASRAGKPAWLIIFCLSLSFTAQGQKYFFDNYGVKQGLGEQKVYTLLQDSRDYIWLGTANGLSRFDGKRFENFSSRNGLAPGGVRSIAEDNEGNLWLGHLNGGITRYSRGQFEQAAFDSVAITGDITSITVISDSSIWFTSITDGAIFASLPIKDLSRIKAKQYRGKDGLSDQVSGSAVNSKGEFICIADVGMRKFNYADMKFENYRMPHMTTYFNPICLLDDSRGRIWFGTYKGGIYRYNLAQSRMEDIDLVRRGMKSNSVTCITEDSGGRIWVGTWGGGVGVFTGDSLKIYNESNGLKADNIYDIIEDVEGNILISDAVNGLTIFKGDAFTSISEPEILPDPNVYAIYQDRSGSVWFGTDAGISKYLPWSGRKGEVFNQKSSSIFEEIRFFREDRNGNLWIGANGGGVIMYNMKTSRFESQPYINSTLYREGIVKAMEIDKANNLWIGTLDGVAVGTIGENNFRRYTTMDSLTVSVITALYCDPEGNMWIGTEPRPGKPGLIKYIPSREDFIPVRSLPGIIPKALVMDRRGILWIGTGEGLLAFRNDSLLYTLTRDDGLLSDNINILAEGPDGSIFIGTNNGLNRYFPGNRRIFSYTERNGFPGIETKPNAVFRSPSGELWFGTASGATWLRPSLLKSTGLEPLTHLLGMKINYEERAMMPGMKLSFKERSVLFDYYSICLTNPDVVRYKVRLDDADKEWRPVTDQTQVIYSALPPGKYTFNLTASNSEGLWNTEPIQYSFTIRPPFYRTWWFILFVAVATGLAIISYIKIREQNLIREKIILEEKVRERTAEVVQKSLIIEEKNRDITASIRYAERIQRAMLPRQDAYDNTFIIYMPKDIVSGDFYWMHDNGDSLFIAAVDCTGHGVPGAFMSIIGHNSLNKVVREYGLTRPAAILDQLNAEVNKAILQSQEKGINDGMDLTLIVYNRKLRTLECSGAYNPLYQVRNGEVIVHKTDRFPIGMVTLEHKKSFSNIEIDIRPGDMLYMSSDGYADQFGYADMKKFKTVNLKRLFSEIWNLPVSEQKNRLEKEITEWKGELPQVDDIMLIGMRIPD